MQTETAIETAFDAITKEVVQQVVKRNKDLPPTELSK